MKALVGLVLSFGAVPFPVLAQQAPDVWRKGDIAPAGKWSVGLEYDTASSRDMDETSLSGTEFDDLGNIASVLSPLVETEDVELKSTFIYLRAAYSIYAPAQSPFAIEGYVLLGMADVEMRGDVTEPTMITNDFDVEGDSEFAYGLGVRARLYRTEKLTVLADLSFRASKHDTEIDPVERLDLDFTPPDTISQDFETELFGYHLSVYASYRLQAGKMVFAPYGGFRLSWLTAKIDGEQSFFDPGFDGTMNIDWKGEQSDVFGIFMGVEAAFTENLSAYLEIRFVDETAVTLGAGWKF